MFKIVHSNRKIFHNFDLKSYWHRQFFSDFIGMNKAYQDVWNVFKLVFGLSPGSHPLSMVLLSISNFLLQLYHNLYLLMFLRKLRDCCQILFRLLSIFEWIKLLLFLLKSSENLWLYDDFRGKSYFAQIGSLIIEAKFGNNS